MRLFAILLASVALMLATPDAQAATPTPTPTPPAATVAPQQPGLGGVIGGVIGGLVPECTRPPAMGDPATGPAAELDRGPETPADGDPFAPGTEVSTYEVYGWGGMAWPNYELGCASRLTAPVSSSLGDMADFMLSGLIIASAFTTAAIRFALDPETIAVLDPVLRLGVLITGESVWVPLGWIGFALAGLGVMLASREGQLSAQARNALYALGVVTLAAIIVTYPLSGVRIVDRALTGALAAVNGAAAEAAGDGAASPADAIGANVHDGVVYSVWSAGMFGRLNGDTADKYGPRLFDASTLTRAEYELVQRDPEAGAALIEQKQADYKQAAEELKAEDPAAYAWMAGEHNGGRVWYAVLGWMLWLLTSAFNGVAALLAMYGLLLLRLVAVIVPVIALVAVLPRFRHHLAAPLGYLIGVLWTAFRFGAVAAAYSLLVGIVIRPGGAPLGFGYMLVILGLITVGAWMLAGPRRAMNALTGTSYIRGVRSRFDRYMSEEGPEGGSPADTPRRPAAAGPGYAPTRAPAGPSVADTVRAAAAAAATGAAVGATMAAVTGGTSVAAGAAAGATRAGVTAVAGGPAGEVAGAAVTARTSRPVALADAPAERVEPPTSTGTGTASPGPNRPTPTSPVGDPPMRLYRPGSGAGDTARRVDAVTDADGLVYPIYTPRSDT